MRSRCPPLALAVMVAACAGDPRGGSAPDGGGSAGEIASESLPLIALLSAGIPAFGVFVPDERPAGERAPDGSRLPAVYSEAGGAALAADNLLDYVFLNLEDRYDPEAITSIATGLASREPAERKALLVRIPPIGADGEDAARARVLEALDRGADGVVFPHVRTPDEARLAVSFFTDRGIVPWSPRNPDGDKIAMLMIEDPVALERRAEIADTPGASVLACGIGSLTRALGGDREAAPRPCSPRADGSGSRTCSPRTSTTSERASRRGSSRC